MTNRTQPIDTLRDGPLKAAIWENEGPSGPFYAVSFARTYRDEEGRLADVTSFVGADILRLAWLATEAYAKTKHLRQASRSAPNEAAAIDDGDRDEAPEAEPPARRFDRQSRNGARRGAAPR